VTRTEARSETGRAGWERLHDPYLVEPALTLTEWRRRRSEPLVEVVLPHDGTWLN
jgi:hypothetical protein